jgi:hypothetical protein
MLSGFNGEYTHHLASNGKSTWRMPTHIYLGISIRPTVIEFDEDDNRWVLRSDDNWTQTFYSKRGRSDEVPFGAWNGIYVSDRDDGSFVNTLALWPVGAGLFLFGGLVYAGFKLAPVVVALIADWSARQVPVGGAFLIGLSLFFFVKTMS